VLLHYASIRPAVRFAGRLRSASGTGLLIHCEIAVVRAAGAGSDVKVRGRLLQLMRPTVPLFLVLLAILGAADSSRPAQSLNLRQADPRKYAPFIVKALYRDKVAGTSLSALTETEKAMNGDSWFWTDDNAKALEALTLPSIFPNFLPQVGQLVKFIRANSPPPFVFRRRADDRLMLESDKPDNYHLATGLMNFYANLRQGEFRQGYRFHDVRIQDAAKYTGDYVRFSLKGKAYSTDVKQTIVATDVRRQEHSITLEHTSELRADTAVVGNVAYAYKIELYKPYVALSVTIKSSKGITLNDVEATTSLDQLDSLSNVRYSKFFAFPGAAPPVSVNATNSTQSRVLREGPTKWWSLIQNGNLGDSYTINTILGAPSLLRSIVSTEEHNGTFHHIYARYGVGNVSADHPVTLSERKVLLAGGLYNSMSAYDGVFARLDDFPGLDLSISYDIGAEVNGVACAYLADKLRIAATPGATPVAYEPETRAWFDAILDGYLSDFLVKVGRSYPYIFSRGLAFTILAVDTMHVATGEPRYLDIMSRLANVLLHFQVKSGPVENNLICNGNDTFLDCHAADMVALARAAVATGDRRYAEAARRGLQAYRIDPNADTGHDVYVLQNAQVSNQDGYYWIFKAGLLLRSMEALEVLSERGLIKLKRDEWYQIQELQRRSLDYIARTVHARGNLDELFTCHKSGETNSETQAWALLGLYRIEHERSEGR